MAEAQLARLDQPGAFGVAAAGATDGNQAPHATRRRPLAERRQLLVHLRSEDLHAGRMRAELHDGTPLEGETFLRLACDAGLLLAKTDARGDVLDVGRLSRTVTA